MYKRQPEATQVLVRATRQRVENSDYDLTDRENEVLALLAEGLSNAEIAERLVISITTVKFHVRNLLSKLGVTSRAEAVAMAWQHHLIHR